MVCNNLFKGKKCSALVNTNYVITYQNKVGVPTSFLTNFDYLLGRD